jgi:transposase
MLHLVLAVADQSKNRLDTVIFSRFGELSDEFLGDLLAAIRRVNPDYFNPTLWRRVIRTQIHRRQQADDAIVDLGDERGAVGRMGSEISILLSRYAGRAIPVWRSSKLTIAGRSRFSRFLT